jgi:predicted ATPase
VGCAEADHLVGSLLTATATGGTGGCLVLDGPAGIGKTRMLLEAAVRADRLGLAVASGRACELDRTAPLRVLLAALHGSRPPVVGDDEMADLRERAGNRLWLVDRVAELVEGYSRHRPLLVSLDDLQWADELTALALQVLVPALREAPVLWLLARRPLPGAPPARRALDRLVADGARTFTLGPLPEPAVVEMCATVLGAEPGPSLVDLARLGGGNPFLVERLLAALREANRISVRDGVVAAAGGKLPDALLSAADRLLRDLSARSRRLLEAGAVLGRPFTLPEAAAVLEERPVRLLDAAREAIEAAVLADRGHVLAFRHDIVRTAVYAGLPGPARQALHGSAARVLRDVGRPGPEVTSHLDRSGGRT